jgi:hypothetical protein
MPRTASRSDRLSWHACGATCIGPGHRAGGKPNQDRWRRFSGSFGLGVVACDGMGSARHAELGAAAACAAVAQAVRLWSASAGAADEDLIRLVELLWAMRVAPLGRRAAATTCLFAVQDGRDEVLLAQLGDGIVLVRGSDAAVAPLAPPREGFLDQTTGLGISLHNDAWIVRRHPADSANLVLLATDGVADDLIADKFGEFVDFFRNEILPLPPATRWRELRRELQYWPTPFHSDDKTIALLWRSDAQAARKGEIEIGAEDSPAADSPAGSG